MQSQHRRASQLPSSALVGFAGVGEAVANYDFSLLQRRLDDLANMLRPRRKHQRQLRSRVKTSSMRIQDQRPDAVTQFGPAGLARGHDLESFWAQSRRQFFRLRAFAATIQPFEGYE